MINPRQQWLHLMSERRPIYEKLATITVSSDNSKPAEVAKTITDKNGTMRTTDEMFQFIIMYLEYQKGDEEMVLEKERKRKSEQKKKMKKIFRQ